MNIIIAGAGMVGSTLTQLLTAEGHDVTLIDSTSAVLDSTVEQFDIMSIHGNCASMEILQQAGIMEAELLIAVTNMDEVNLLCCITAHSMNPKLHTIARIRNPDYTGQIYSMRNNFGLSMSINPEKQAAVEIDRLLQYPGFLKRDSFAKGKTEIVELKVDAASPLCNIALKDLNNIVKCRVLVCAVLRQGQAIAPNGNFVLQEGDRIFVTAPTENLTTLLKNLGILTRRVRRVMICGGGRISYYLATNLQKHGIKVTLIEQKESRCHELAAQLPNTTIIHGDCTDRNLLESEGLTDVDAMVNMTGIDELNMITSLYGMGRGINQVITKMNRMANRNIIDTLNLGSVICPKELCCNNIARYVRAMQNQSGAAISVHAIADGQAEAVEFLVDAKTPHCGIALKDLKLKANVLLVSITRAGRTEIPNGASCFQPGDIIVVVANRQHTIHSIDDIFA